MKPVILLDFDRTLFDTDSFWADFSICLAEASGLKSSVIFKDYENYVSDKDKLRFIDYDNLILRHSINHKFVLELMKKRMSNKHYLFADVLPTLKLLELNDKQIEVAILTFGQYKFQKMKISLCKELKNTTTYVTLLPKNEFIQYYLSGRTGYLVDDKAGQNLPAGWVEVHLNRQVPLDSANRIKSRLFEISNLAQISEIAKLELLKQA
jgi:hypothetical protein